MPLMTFFFKLENFVILLNMPFTWGLKLCYKYYLFLRILCNIAKYHRLQLYNNHLHSSEDNSGVLNLSCSYNQLTTLSQHQPLYWFSVHQIWMLLKTVHVNKHLYSKLDLCLKKKKEKRTFHPRQSNYSKCENYVTVTHCDIQYSTSWHVTLAYMKALGKKNRQKGNDILLTFCLC